MEVVYSTMFFSNFGYVECWFIDGNYFSKQLFGTLEVAQSKAKTLRNCVGCFDCTDCQDLYRLSKLSRMSELQLLQLLFFF
ncbi:MAG: hypothetical protein J1E31_02495 [Helicobacter sp.]|nr:hypothetical protein [Helicobacter sp.]